MLGTSWKIAFSFLMLATLFGCATKTAFVYDHPQIKPSVASGRVLLCKEMRDLRSERSLDDMYESNPLLEVKNIIEQEVMSTGLFEKVVWTADGQEKLKGQTGQLFLDTSLKELSWEVPDYQQIQTNAFIFSFVTGLIGGLIYGATSTDVNGTSKLSIQLLDLPSGKTLLDKEYKGVFTTSKSKFKCDVTSTKAEVAGKALKDSMEQFKKDLIKVMTTTDTCPSAVPIPAPVIEGSRLPGKS